MHPRDEMGETYLPTKQRILSCTEWGHNIWVVKSVNGVQIQVPWRTVRYKVQTAFFRYSKFSKQELAYHPAVPCYVLVLVFFDRREMTRRGVEGFERAADENPNPDTEIRLCNISSTGEKKQVGKRR